MSKKISIAIDGNEANINNRVGSNVYAFEIISQLEQLATKNKDLDITVLLAAEPVSDLPKSRSGWQYKVIKPTFFWTQWALPIYLHLYQDSFDVFFTPSHYAPRLCPIPYVSSVMDLAFLKFPKQFKRKDLIQLKKWTKYSIEHATKVVAISQFTKQDIVDNYKVKANDIVIAYPAAAKPKKRIYKKKANQILKKLNVAVPYLLYVGTFQPRKNIKTIIEAFESVQRSLKVNAFKIRGSSKQDLQLVLAGKIGWLAKDTLKAIKESPFKDKIVTPGFVTQEEKQVLLQNTSALLQVGLYEGFGMTALEALQFGTIPIISNSTSLPEVVGRAGIRVSPQSKASVASAMKKALQFTKKEQSAFKKIAKRQFTKFSWKDSAEKILETLIDIAKKSEKN